MHSYNEAILLAEFIRYSQTHTPEDIQRTMVGLAKCIHQKGRTLNWYSFWNNGYLTVLEAVKACDAQARPLDEILSCVTEDVRVAYENSLEDYEEYCSDLESALKWYGGFAFEVKSEKLNADQDEACLSMNEITYAERFNLNVKQYCYALKQLGLGNRSTMYLRRSGIHTVADLLLLTPQLLRLVKDLDDDAIKVVESMIGRLASSIEGVVAIKSEPSCETIEEASGLAESIDQECDSGSCDEVGDTVFEENSCPNDEETSVAEKAMNLREQAENPEVFDETPYMEIYGVELQNFEDVPIEQLVKSARATNLLHREGFNTIAQVISLTPLQLMRLRGLGRKTFEEIEMAIAMIVKREQIPTIERQCKNHALEICRGDFGWTDNLELTNEERQMLTQYQAAQEIVGENLAVDAYNGKVSILLVLEALKAFSKSYLKRQERKEALNEALNDVPRERWEQQAYGYLRAFSRKSKDEELLRLVADECPRLKDVVNYSGIDDYGVFSWLLQFLKFASFDLQDDINTLMENLSWYTKIRNKKILKIRARGGTLAEAGDATGVTRERVRQIELKLKRIFNSYQSRRRYLLKISALRNCDDILTVAELKEYFGEYSDVMIYLHKSAESRAFYYDEQLDGFIVGDNSLSSRIHEYLDSLPEVFKDSKLREVVTVAYEEHDIPEEVFMPAFNETYKKTGNTYHRSRMTHGMIFARVLETHYPEGLHVYDEAEIAEFRRHVREDFGDIDMSESDRYLAAHLGRIGILCGRGIYRSKKSSYISVELASKIQKYIDDSSSSILLMNTLFFEFEDELKKFGVENKYYLQGILKELFGQRYWFRRDYLSKDAETTSLYNEIVQFIKNSQYPVSKQQIQAAYPGITDIVITIAVSDAEVLNYFGEYLHSCHLRVSPEEQTYLKDVLTSCVSDGKEHHIKDAYELVCIERKDILDRNGINIPFRFFSVVAYLFENSFNFERPLLAEKSVKIEGTQQRIAELVLSSGEIAISQIMDLAKESHYTVYSILDLLNSFNKTHFIVDQQTLMTIPKTGLDHNYYETIEDMILNELTDPVPISSLECLHRLKSIGVPWSDWLLYSAINRWSTVLEVLVTSKYFKQSIPIVGLRGTISDEALARYSDVQNHDILQVDDLDNIDDLIADYVLEDWEDL